MTAHPAEPMREHPAAATASVVVASVSIVLALIGIGVRPALLTPIAAVLALAAALISDRRRNFAAAAVGVAGLAWLVGMTIAVLTGNQIL